MTDDLAKVDGLMDAPPGFVFWGVDCVLPGGCDGTTTPGSMRCDVCKSTEFTVPLFVPDDEPADVDPRVEEDARRFHPVPEIGEVRPFGEMRSHGLVWLINRSLLHPRGFALGIDYADGGHGDATGWALFGDGHEPWHFELDAGLEDEMFTLVQRLLAPRDEVAAPDG